MRNYATGITYVRRLRDLHYPLGLTMQSMVPLAKRVVVTEPLEVGGVIGYLSEAGVNDVAVVPTHAPWHDLGVDGNSRLRAVLRTALMHAEGGLDVLYLEADECMEPRHVEEMLVERPAVAWLPRWQLWPGRMGEAIRLDWSLFLPRFCAVEALLDALDHGRGDASCLPVRRDFVVAQFPQWPIWHLSRLGGPRMIAKRRRAVAELYVDNGDDLYVPDRYDFVPRRYENWERGKMPPACEGMFAEPATPPPTGVYGWAAEDLALDAKP